MDLGTQLQQIQRVNVSSDKVSFIPETHVTGKDMDRYASDLVKLLNKQQANSSYRLKSDETPIGETYQAHITEQNNKILTLNHELKTTRAERGLPLIHDKISLLPHTDQAGNMNMADFLHLYAAHLHDYT